MNHDGRANSHYTMQIYGVIKVCRISLDGKYEVCCSSTASLAAEVSASAPYYLQHLVCFTGRNCDILRRSAAITFCLHNKACDIAFPCDPDLCCLVPGSWKVCRNI